MAGVVGKALRGFGKALKGTGKKHYTEQLEETVKELLVFQ